MQNAIINVNGQILGPQEAKISVFDRGYLYGDSLYEVARTYHGKLYLLAEHLQRLQKSAELCKIKLGQSLKTYEAEIYRTLTAFQGLPGNNKVEAYARLIVSRGSGRIGFGLSTLETSTLFTVIVQPVEPPSVQQLKKGLQVAVTERLRLDPRALNPAMKSGNYLNSLLAYLEATENGYTDALLCNADGHLTEGTTFNLFYVRRGIVATPPLDVGILAGITRWKTLELIQALGLPFREIRFPKERLYEADEVFLTSSIREVLPITSVDGKKIGKGKCGPITQKLLIAYRQSVEKELSR